MQNMSAGWSKRKIGVILLCVVILITVIAVINRGESPDRDPDGDFMDTDFEVNIAGLDPSIKTIDILYTLIR